MIQTLSSPEINVQDVNISQPPSLENNLQAALEHARRLTAMNGTDNIEVALAWETVTELQKAKADQAASKKSSLISYCEANPDAPECRIYED